MERAHTTYRDTRAWEAGFKAAKEGKSANRCPHDAGSVQAKSWLEGYTEGSAREKVS